MEFRKFLHNINPATYAERGISPSGVANYFLMDLALLGGGLYLAKQRNYGEAMYYIVLGAGVAVPDAGG